MKIKLNVTYAMEFDSKNGRSNTSVSFTLPEHPKVKITDRIKQFGVEETALLANAIISRGVFADLPKE